MLPPMNRALRFALPLSLLAAVACSDPETDATCSDASRCAPLGTGGGTTTTSSGTGGTGGVASTGGGGQTASPFQATEAYEADIGDGWIAAGQPTEARLTEVVEIGARIITLRAAAEDPFDEQGLVEGLGGTFIRYATTATDYQDVAFREAMYDLYDVQFAMGGYVYLHCASSNRVGASWALYNAERRGVPAEEAVQMGIAAGLAGLEPMVRSILGI